MANGDSGVKGFITWQNVAVALASLLGSAFILLEKSNVDHLGTLDLAMSNQASALYKMSGSLDQLTMSNNRFQDSLGKIYDRLHGVEEAQANTLAQVVTNEHDISQLREEMNRHLAADVNKWKSIEAQPHL